MNNTCVAAFKLFDPLIHASLWKNSSVHTWQPMVDGSLPLLLLQIPRNALLHVACPWCEPLVEQSSLCHAHLVQTDYNWKMAVFWVVASCSLVEVYHHFRSPHCLHHQGDDRTLPWWWRQQGPLKRW
jgi:hypothetical protein